MQRSLVVYISSDCNHEDHKRFVLQEFRRWGRDAAEALHYYNIVMKDSEGVPSEERDKYIEKRIRQYFDDLV